MKTQIEKKSIEIVYVLAIALLFHASLWVINYFATIINFNQQHAHNQHQFTEAPALITSGGLTK